VGVRPESFALTGADTAEAMALQVRLVEELGADAFVYGVLPGDDPEAKPIVMRFDGRVPPRIGDAISVTVRTDELHAFDADTGDRLG
ncbi:MAG: TOBE domain-containing protein, partial [Trebonia sp.]